MVSQQETIFKISSKVLLLRWFILLLLFVATVFIPFMIVTAGQVYPNLDTALIYYSGTGFIWIMLLADYQRQIISVQIDVHHILIKPLGQAPKQFDYASILAYHERLDSDKGGVFTTLTVYTNNDYFVVKSNEFKAYALLRDILTQYGKPVPHRQVMTLAERNRLRWLIGGLALLIGTTITFGYVAHNPAGREPARLTAIAGIVDRVLENRNKRGLTGFTIQLRNWPDFHFWVNRRNYETDIRLLKQAISLQQPVTLLLRESEYRKKLLKTEPLTFGDKYSDYNDILVFGVSQGNRVSIRTTRPVYDPTHTNPNQRAFLLSILWLLCWTGWVYVDQHKVLRADR